MPIRPTIEQLCEQYRIEVPHTTHVTSLALRIFDTARHTLGLAESLRSLLHASCMLHDLGYSVDPAGHGAVGAGILLRKGMRGVPARDTAVAAHILFLHQKKFRGRKSFAGQPISKRAFKLAAIVRIADGLDHSHAQNTRIQSVRCTKRLVRIEVQSPGYTANVHYAMQKADLWKYVFKNCRVQIIEARRAKKAERFEGIVRRTDTTVDAARKVLLVLHRCVADNYHAALGGRDPEALHDLRTSLRRMRVAMGIFAEHLSGGPFIVLTEAIRKMEKALGPVRDIDVWIEFLRAPATVQTMGERRAWQPFVEKHCAQGRAARAELRRRINTGNYVALMREISSCLRTCNPVRAGDGRAKPLRRFAAKKIRKSLLRMRKNAGKALAGNPKQIHALRKKCRRARYTAEFFAPALGPAGRRLVRQLTVLTDALGALHDRDMYLARISAQPAVLPRGLRPYIARMRADAMRRFRREWRSFNSRRFAAETISRIRHCARG